MTVDPERLGPVLGPVATRVQWSDLHVGEAALLAQEAEELGVQWAFVGGVDPELAGAHPHVRGVRCLEDEQPTGSECLDGGVEQRDEHVGGEVLGEVHAGDGTDRTRLDAPQVLDRVTVTHVEAAPAVLLGEGGVEVDAVRGDVVLAEQLEPLATAAADVDDRPVQVANVVEVRGHQPLHVFAGASEVPLEVPVEVVARGGDGLVEHLFDSGFPGLGAVAQRLDERLVPCTHPGEVGAQLGDVVDEALVRGGSAPDLVIEQSLEVGELSTLRVDGRLGFMERPLQSLDPDVVVPLPGGDPLDTAVERFERVGEVAIRVGGAFGGALRQRARFQVGQALADPVGAGGRGRWCRGLFGGQRCEVEADGFGRRIEVLDVLDVGAMRVRRPGFGLVHGANPTGRASASSSPTSDRLLA